MEWIPVVLLTFKLLVFGTGMFFAIKWHYDREKQEREKRQRQAEAAQGGPEAPR